MKNLVIPISGSIWKHHNGNIYTVIDVYNLDSERPDQYPITIGYQGENGKKWSRPFSDWHRSMTLIRGNI